MANSISGSINELRTAMKAIVAAKNLAKAANESLRAYGSEGFPKPKDMDDASYQQQVTERAVQVYWNFLIAQLPSDVERKDNEAVSAALDVMRLSAGIPSFEDLVSAPAIIDALIAGVTDEAGDILRRVAS